MTIRETLEQDMKSAMREKNKVRLQTIRSLRAALMQKEIELRTSDNSDLTEAMVLAVLQKQAKQRRDSIEQYTNAGRSELAAQESTELEIIESYLPEQLSQEEIRSKVSAIVAEVGATSMKDMGRVMGPAMGQLKGLADGKLVQQAVRELLSN